MIFLLSSFCQIIVGTSIVLYNWSHLKFIVKRRLLFLRFAFQNLLMPIKQARHQVPLLILVWVLIIHCESHWDTRTRMLEKRAIDVAFLSMRLFPIYNHFQSWDRQSFLISSWSWFQIIPLPFLNFKLSSFPRLKCFPSLKTDQPLEKQNIYGESPVLEQIAFYHYI